jgi:putative transposase
MALIDLPGYTGLHPRDLRRALADPKGDLRLYVSLDELEELEELLNTPLRATTVHRTAG